MTPLHPSVGPNAHELLVPREAGPGLRQRLEQERPEYIAIHDVATRAARKLLAGIASAARGAVHQMVIRREGDGVALAALPFVDVPTAEGRALRIYATDIEGITDAAARDALARTLLAFSTLGVVFVGEAPAPSIAGVFQPLHDDMIAGPWPNRHLLLLPMSTGNPLVAQGMELARGTGVDVRTTPQVAKPAEAWKFISGTWARLHGAAARTRATASGSLGSAPMPAVVTGAAPVRTAPMPYPGMVGAPTAGRAAAAGPDLLGRYVQQLAQITGMVGCCLFDVATGRLLLHAGAGPAPSQLAEHGAEVLATLLSSCRALGLGHAMPEVAITLGAHHLLLRAVPAHPGLAVHAVLDKEHANLTLARLQIARMDSLFEEPSA